MMNDRIKKIIDYKTRGKQVDFAQLMGWSPQYTNKLLNGTAIGITPIITIVEKLPEIDARWLLTGEGAMLSDSKIGRLSDSISDTIQELMDLDELIPVMDANELAHLEEAISKGEKPNFSPDTLLSLRNRATARKMQLDAKFKRLYAESKRK